MFYQFWIPFALMSLSMFYCERKWCMLRDPTKGKPQPYSWSRIQLAWWSVILLSSFISILWIGVQGVHKAPTFTMGAVALLGISALTTISARSVTNSSSKVSTGKGENFFLDVLSDDNGISIARFQTVVFNIVFGIWFISAVLENMASITDINAVMPEIEKNNLVLLGLSSATYLGMKLTDQKQKNKVENAENQQEVPDKIPDDINNPAVG
ncbi:hypothetical protein BH09BAC2_BH09BAC2_02530 [soil metagenome]